MESQDKAGMEVRDVLRKLADMERRSLESGAALPESVVQEEDWSGLAYKIGGVRVISAMREIYELLPFPDSVTRVPGTRSWMLGLANVRGNLMPIVDLQMFMGGGPIEPDDDTRVLVVRHHGLSTGLVVPKVLGMRHMPEDQHVQNARFDGVLGGYVYEAFNSGNEIWPVFSMAALMADSRFLTAAA